MRAASINMRPAHRYTLFSLTVRRIRLYRRGPEALRSAHALRSIGKCLGRRFRLRTCETFVVRARQVEGAGLALTGSARNRRHSVWTAAEDLRTRSRPRIRRPSPRRTDGMNDSGLSRHSHSVNAGCMKARLRLGGAVEWVQSQCRRYFYENDSHAAVATP
jgi:hypothetical protein